MAIDVTDAQAFHKDCVDLVSSMSSTVDTMIGKGGDYDVIARKLKAELGLFVNEAIRFGNLLEEAEKRELPDLLAKHNPDRL